MTKGRIVLLTFDPAQRPWLTDYLPELARLDDAQMPAMADYARWLGPVRIEPLLVIDDEQRIPAKLWDRLRAHLAA